tara:strand:+ start:10584 stop:11126 length:543 start_codon:yes stop_codon:yes gene_type:complete
MFFYLLNNSTFVTSSDKKRTYLNVIIYGSLLYILVHALFFLRNDSFSKLKYYFWIILLLDVSILVFFEMNTVNHSINDFFITNNTPETQHKSTNNDIDNSDDNDNDNDNDNNDNIVLKPKQKVKKKVTFENKSVSLEDLKDMDITDTESINMNDSDFDMTDIDIDIDELSNELSNELNAN